MIPLLPRYETTLVVDAARRRRSQVWDGGGANVLIQLALFVAETVAIACAET